MTTDYHHYWTGKLFQLKNYMFEFIKNLKCLSPFEYLYQIDDKFLQVIY